MQLLDRVREIRAEEANLDAKHFTRARSHLAEEIHRELNRTVRSKRRLGLKLSLSLGGLGAAAAGTFAVVAIVASSVVAPPPGGVSSAAAAEVLERAAQSVLTHVSAADTPLAPGQYLRIETTRNTVTTDGSAQDKPAESGAFSEQNVTVTYVPADRSADWIVETKAEVITGVYGPDGEEFLERVKAEPIATEPSIRAFPAGIRTYGDEKQPIDMYRDSYDQMPRDPDALLAWFDALAPGGYSWLAILNALYENLPPADLRAAMLGALARTSDFTLVSEAGTVATIERKTEETVQQYVIDTESGVILSVIDPRRHPNDFVPADLPDAVQTFTMSIVDSAPMPTE